MKTMVLGSASFLSVQASALLILTQCGSLETTEPVVAVRRVLWKHLRVMRGVVELAVLCAGLWLPLVLRTLQPGAVWLPRSWGRCYTGGSLVGMYHWDSF